MGEATELTTRDSATAAMGPTSRCWAALFSAALVLLLASALPVRATVPKLLERLAAEPVDVVILGEVHGNPRHHAVQRDVVAALSPPALVFEMIPPASEAPLNAARADGADRATLYALLDWANSGWPPFNFYAEILEAAPTAHVEGAERTREGLRRAVAEGAGPGFGPGAARFGLDRPLPPAEQAAREARQAEAHCNVLPAALLPGMVAAQRVRDAALAEAVLDARARTGGPVVVITGNGHARRDWGLPALLSIAAPELTTLSIAQTEGAAGTAEAAAFDMTLPAPPVERADPCAAFSDGD